MDEASAGVASVPSDAGDVRRGIGRRPLRSAALVVGWVALVLALLPFGLFLVTKIGRAFSYPYVVPLYAALVALVVAVNRCVARAALVPAVVLAVVAVLPGALVFGYFAWPSIAALVVEVSLAAAAARQLGRLQPDRPG